MSDRFGPDINENIQILYERNKNNPGSIDKWVGYIDKKVDPAIRDTLSQQTIFSITDPKAKGIKNGLNYDFDKFIFEKDNISVATNPEGKIFVERRDGNGDLFVGIFDTRANDFYTAKVDPTTKALSKIDNLEDARGIVFAGIFAQMRRSENIQFSKTLDEIHNIYVAGQTYIDTNSIEPLIQKTSQIGKDVYDKYFSLKDKEPPHKINNINFCVTKDMDTPTGAMHFFGNKDFEFFNKIEKNRYGTIGIDSEKLYDTYNVNAATHTSEERQATIDRIKARTLAVTPELQKTARIISEKIHENRISKEMGFEKNIKPAFVVFQGPSGSGKTYIAKAMEDIIGVPFHTITCSADMTAERFWYSKELQEGNSINAESEAIRILKNGGIILIDEINNLHNQGILSVFNSVIASGYFTSPTGEMIRVHPDTAIICSGNYGHANTYSLLDSLMDRRTLIIDFRPLSKDDLYNVCEVHAQIRYNTISKIADRRNKQILLPEDEMNKYIKELCSVISGYNNALYDSSAKKIGRSGISDERYITVRQAQGIIKDALSQVSLIDTTTAKPGNYNFGALIYDAAMSKDASPLNNYSDKTSSSEIKSCFENSIFYDEALNFRSVHPRRRKQ